MTISFLTHPALPTASHGFFTRQGGVSTGLYDSLNCGYGAIDDPAQNVTENRRRAAAALGATDATLVGVYQVHSPDAVWVDSPWDRADAPRADAMVTDRPGLALGILTADCAPVLFWAPKARMVGAAHAGWKGALDGVTDTVIQLMTDRGAELSDIRAVVGPCIQQRSYQVDSGFHARFLDVAPANAAFFIPDAQDPARWRFDLPGYVCARLRAAGVSHAGALPDCTCADADRFFSNRRRNHNGQADYGRGLSAIMAPKDLG